MDDVRPIGSSPSPSAAFRHRFVLLLAALTLLLLATPFVHVLGPNLHPRLARGVITILFVAIRVHSWFCPDCMIPIIALARASPVGLHEPGPPCRFLKKAGPAGGDEE